MKRRNWTREQLIVAFNLYCRIEFSKINYRNPAIIKLAEAIDRTPSAVAWKLVNFASLDPSLIKRGIKGASNSGKLDKIVFEELPIKKGIDFLMRFSSEKDADYIV